MATAAAILSASLPVAAHSVRYIARPGLILLSFAATMSTASPIAGVLWLVWSFIHVPTREAFQVIRFR
jgi:hypothetical protein